jgi:hypothetical protein
MGRKCLENTGEIADIYWSPPNMLEACVPQAERGRHRAKGFSMIASLRRTSYSECDVSNTTWSCHQSRSKNVLASSTGFLKCFSQ